MNPISLSAILTNNDPLHSEIQWLIPDVLPIGLTLLQGQPRVGKSWLTLHLALSIALGDTALAQLPTTRTDVLYFGLQDTQQHTSNRVRKLLGTRSAPENFLWTNKWFTSSSAPDQISALDLWLTAHPHTRLLVIDSLQNLLSTSLSSIAQQELVLLKQLKALADNHNIAILVTNQYATNVKRSAWNENTYDASFAIVDAIMVLKRDRGQSDATLHLVGTNLPDQELALNLSMQSMSWILLGPANDYRLSQERQDILALLEEHCDGPLRPKEIASLLHKDVRAVTKLLFDMSHASQIRLLGRGQYMTIKSINPAGTQPSYVSHLAKIRQTLDSNHGNVVMTVMMVIIPNQPLLTYHPPSTQIRTVSLKLHLSHPLTPNPSSPTTPHHFNKE